MSNPKFKSFVNAFNYYLQSGYVKHYIITIAYIGTSGIRVPAAFLFFEDSVKIIVPKVTPALLGLNIKSELEEFEFSNDEMATLELYYFQDIMLCYQLKKKKIAVVYEVIIQIELLLLREYLDL